MRGSNLIGKTETKEISLVAVNENDFSMNVHLIYAQKACKASLVMIGICQAFQSVQSQDFRSAV